MFCISMPIEEYQNMFPALCDIKHQRNPVLLMGMKQGKALAFRDIFSFDIINLSCFHTAAETFVVDQASINPAPASSIRCGLCSPLVADKCVDSLVVC